MGALRLRPEADGEDALIEIIWAAGLFEGEGSICVHTSAGKYVYKRVHLALSTTDEDVVRRFHAAVGLGTINGPYQGTNKRYWQWRVTGTKARVVLERLLPYLGERRTAKAEEVKSVCL